MTKADHPPYPYQGAPGFPREWDVKSYAENLRLGAPGASAKGDSWALYWLSSRLDILATHLRANFYSVVALPPGSLEKVKAGSYDQLDYFRGWLLEYGSAPGGWKLRADTREVGTNEFIRLRRELKGA